MFKPYFKDFKMLLIFRILAISQNQLILTNIICYKNYKTEAAIFLVCIPIKNDFWLLTPGSWLYSPRLIIGWYTKYMIYSRSPRYVACMYLAKIKLSCSSDIPVSCVYTDNYIRWYIRDMIYNDLLEFLRDCSRYLNTQDDTNL